MVAAVIILAGVIYYLTKDYIPKYHWIETYDYESDQPYDLKLTYDLLAGSRAKNDFILINRPPLDFLNKPDTSVLYMFIGLEFYTDSVTSNAFIDFVKRGNNVFISSIESSHSLFQILTKEKYSWLTYDTFRDSVVKIKFHQNTPDSIFKFDYKLGKKLELHKWYGFEKSFFADSLSSYGFEQISSIEYGMTDCFRVKYGKGWFIFHFNPILFTNYNMRQEEGLRYTNQLLSSYNKQKIYWDAFSKSPVTKNNAAHESPLRFILSQRSLKWSWYLLCIFILIFVVFNAKRKQAYIPLLPSNRNTTVEYITSIATLHYQHNSIVFLADEILKQLLSFSKHKYGISPNLERKELIKVLAKKSGIPEESIKTLFKRHSEVKYSPIFEIKDILEFYKITEYFYQNCK